MLEALETAFYAVLAAGALAYYARNHLQSDERTINEAKRLYSEEKIDEPELERRLGEAVDDRHEQIRLVYVRGVAGQRSSPAAGHRLFS